MGKKSIAIIGAGISGLSAGIYSLQNEYDVTIYEKHFRAGGECTTWKRDGVIIDGSAHWICGTNKSSDLYPLWKNVGVLDDDTTIHETEYFRKVVLSTGETITVYADLNLLKEELYKIALKSDKRKINHFIKMINKYHHIVTPNKKPLDMMNIFEKISIGLKLLPAVPYITKYGKISIFDYANSFESDKLKELFKRICKYDLCVHNFLYIMSNLSLVNAGAIEGGSDTITDRMVEKFKSLGGTLLLSSPIKEIKIDNNHVIGVINKDGELIKYDYVISSVDIHHLMFDLTNNKLNLKQFRERFSDINKYHLNQGVIVNYKCTKDISNIDKMVDILIDEFYIGEFKVDHITVRNYSYDKLQSSGGTPVSVIINVDDKVYEYFKSLERYEYLKEKNRIGELIKSRIMEYYNVDESEFTLIDVATPLTHERYCNSYHGSYMSFAAIKRIKKTMESGLVKDIDNLILTGQWLMSPGGLPVALMTGKHAAYYVSYKDKKKFIDLD